MSGEWGWKSEMRVGGIYNNKGEEGRSGVE